MFNPGGSSMVFAVSPFATREGARSTRECWGATGNGDRFSWTHLAIRSYAFPL